LTRLSTGTRINSGKDDPAGLFAGEFLGQEVTSIKSAISNNNRANNVIGTADAALGQIAGLLNDVQGILTTSANKGVLSQEELDANQSSVDSAIQSIDRIAGTTQFAGRKLLDGSLGFQLSGVNRFDNGNATFTDVKVNLANFNSNNSAISVQVTLTTRASQATLNTTAVTAAADSTIELVGNKGAVTINIGSGQSVQAAVNGVSDVTGVTASGTLLRSVDYGKDAFVKVNNRIGGLISQSELTDQGTDAVGTINGFAFSAVGLKASLKSSNLDLDVTFSAGAANASTATFTVESGGAKFQLGQRIDQASQINIGLQSFSSSSLGSVYTDTAGTKQNRLLASLLTGGSNDLRNSQSATVTTGKFGIASDIVSNSLRQVTAVRSRLGSIQKNTIETNLTSLQVTLENVSAAKSQITDTDFAEETANLTRQQIIVQAGTSALAIANSRPQGVLSLLRS
jgi:flagellin